MEVRRWGASVNASLSRGEHLIPPGVQPSGTGQRLNSVHSVIVAANGAGTLAELHRQQYLPMVRLATLVVGSVAIAEEVVQDCFVRLHPKFDQIVSPEAYLRRAVINGCRSVLRRRQRERLRLRQEPVEFAQPGGNELFDALDRLPYRNRAALVLRFYEDLPVAEVAAILECRPGTVKSLVHRGLAALRKELDE